MIDKYGLCPNCQKSWDGEDIYNELNSLSVFTHKSQKSLQELASHFGYSEDNKTKFSKVIVIGVGENIFYKCPEIRCGKVYNSETEEVFDSIVDAKIKINTTTEEEVFNYLDASLIDSKEEEDEW